MKLNKDVLKTGCVVKNSKGKIGCVILGIFNIIQWEDGTWHSLEEQMNDIVKVSKPIKDSDIKLFFEGICMSTIWEKHNFTEEEITILKSLDKGYKYIARDFDGSLYIYCDKPRKYEDRTWANSALSRSSRLPMGSIFKSISYKDEKPVCIADVIKV